jgi:protein-histidine pros-kinase
MGLRLKYNIVLLMACLLGMVGATIMSYVIVRKSAVEDIHQSIDLIHGNAQAVRSYTIDSITPLLSDGNDVLFLPESITSFATRAVFDTFQKQFPEFGYKEAVLDPTNPANRPNALEAEIIGQLRDDPSLEKITRIVDTDEGPVLTVAFPITITQQGCLACHSTPEAAPPTMVDLYGPDNGFGWRLGETVGAQVISAPMSVADKRAMETGVILIAGFAVVFLLVFIMTNLLLSQIVLRPVRLISETARKVSLGDFSVPEYSKPGKDEISSLATSFNLMRRSLERAMSMIDV